MSKISELGKSDKTNSGRTTQSQSRRGFVAASAAVGGLATFAAGFVKKPSTPPTSDVIAQPAQENTAAGYQLTEHVKRYYQSTTI